MLILFNGSFYLVILPDIDIGFMQLHLHVLLIFFRTPSVFGWPERVLGEQTKRSGRKIFGSH